MARRQKAALAGILFFSWALIFVNFSNTGMPPLAIPSSPRRLPVTQFSCTESFWPSAEKCGKHGINCLPDVSGQFESTTLAFHCPAHCVRDAAQDSSSSSSSNNSSLHLAGARDLTARPVVIGGPIYRGDSQVCAAAVHAGVVADGRGGCGVVRRMGQANSFPASDMFAVESVEVRTYFPLTFRFPPNDNDALAGACPHPAADRAWALPWVSLGHSVLFFQMTASAPARAAWVAGLATAHLLRWRALVATPPPAVPPADALPLPDMLEPEIVKQTVTNSMSNITFKWVTPPPGVDGISMLVDDVERERLHFGDMRGKQHVLFWERGPQAFVDYIRFGYVKAGKVLQYSPAGTWALDGSWSGIPARDDVDKE